MTFTETLNEILTGSSGVLLGIFLVPIILYALGGLRRGTLRQLLHAVGMAVSAVIAYVFTRQVWGEFFVSFEEHTLGEYVEIANSQGAAISEELGSIISALDPAAAEYLMALPLGLLVIPIVFSLGFFLVNLLMRIAYFILSRLFVPKAKGMVSRLIGAALGVCEGAVIMSLLLLPVNAVYNIATDTAEALEPKAEVAEVEVLEFTNSVFAEKLLDGFATVKIGDAEIKLGEEYRTLLTAIGENREAFEETDWKALTDADKAALDRIIATAGGSPYLSGLLSGVLRSAASLVDEGALPIPLEPPYGDIISSALVLFRESSAEHLYDDLDTLSEIYYVLSDDGVLVAMQDGGDLHDVLVDKDENGKTVVDHLVAKIRSNPRTAPLVTALVRLSITVMSDTMNAGDDAKEVYDAIKSEVDIIVGMKPEDYPSSGEYLDAVADELDTALTAHGIVVEAPILDDMAEHIASDLQGKESLTEDEFNDLLLTYFSSYADYIEVNPDAGLTPDEDPESPEVDPDMPDDGNTDGEGWVEPNAL